MKLDILDISRNKVGEVDLPVQFDEDVREDLVRRSFLVLRSNKRKPYGAMPEAGKRASVKISKRRRKYRGMYGFGIARTPRKILSRRGTRMYWVGAFSPNTVGGRRAHPPKSEKILRKKINKKERKKAIRICIAASVNSDLVKKKGHIIPENYPFILDKKFEDLSKTKELIEVLKAFELKKELDRVSKRNIRAGKGKSRGRRYKTKNGPLIVVSKESGIVKAADNIPGIDVVNVKNLNVEVLGNGVPGRLTLWTASSLEVLEKEKLFR
ncbi:MAG: 50S ribosomal protein L4 [Nanoarchaeota archaeon]|nr:50S ribosomal protein L4 [Nanoarchaeota archaeon]